MNRLLHRLLYRLLPLRAYLLAVSRLYFLTLALGRGRHTRALEYAYHLPRLLRPGDTAIDIGANLGYYTRPMSRIVGPEGRVYAVEPVPVICEVLRRNLRGRDNVRILNCALGDGDRPVEMANDSVAAAGYFGTGRNFVDDGRNARGDAIRFKAQMRRGSSLFAEDDRQRITALLDHMSERFPQITSLYYVVNTKLNDSISDLQHTLYRGREHILERMEGLLFRVGPKSFYQTNSEQAYELYKVARGFAALTGTETLYDLYTGTGTIANFCAAAARSVIGVEYVPEAIEDARLNSEANGITNTRFYAGDMKDVLNDDFIARNGHPDVMILDPPRAGVDPRVIEVILRAAPERIVYVSCNPATQARDLSLLDAAYRVTAVQPVDMFPHTHHVENVVRLDRR